MKARLLLALAVLWLSRVAFAATAQMELGVDQIRMSPGPCSCGPGMVFKTHFSTVYTEDPLAADGGFVKQPAGSATTHWAFMLFEDISMFSFVSVVQVNLPLGDSNGNGVPDLFEEGPEIVAVTTGTYNVDWGPGTLEFNWYRPAGVGFGTCDLYMNDRILGRLGPFKHTFERSRFTGNMSYQTGPSSRSGTMTISLDPQNSINGSVEFVRTATNSSRNIVLKAATWKMGQADMPVGDTLLTRNPAQSSHYHGVLRWSNGQQSTYPICIVDSNDANANGIPDLSDDVPPQLGARKTGNGTEIVITGEAGRSYDVQGSTTLSPQSWQTITTVVLSNAQQAVPLSTPATGAKFWRIKTPQSVP